MYEKFKRPQLIQKSLNQNKITVCITRFSINHSCKVILNSDEELLRNSVHKKCLQTDESTDRQRKYNLAPIYFVPWGIITPSKQ